MKKKMESFKKYYFLPVLILLATVCMSVGYASINSVILDLSGKATATSQEEAFITDIVYKASINSSSELSKINSFHKTTLNSYIELGKTIDSSITYNVTIYNKNNFSVKYAGITFDPAFYSNGDIICLVNVDPNQEVAAGEFFSFDITFKYREGMVIDETTNNTLSSYLNFSFKRVYNVSYVNILGDNYPTKVVADAPFSVDFSTEAPEQIVVTMGGERITTPDYSNGILNIASITGDIVIEKVTTTNEEALVDNEVSPSSENS